MSEHLSYLGESIPSWARRFLSQNPVEKTHTCPQCGVIAPIHVGDGWYAHRRCPCEQHAEDIRQRQAVPRTLGEALMNVQLAQTFSWLGPSWVQEGLSGKTFTTFNKRTGQPSVSQAAQAAVAFASDPQGVLVLSGSYGLGKTHLLAAIANLRSAAGRPCLFASAVALFDAIQDRIGKDQDYHALIRRAISAPLLLLDDIDKPKPSEFRQEVYYQIIDGRTRADRPLAVSSNVAVSGLEPWIGGAARSRLMMGITPVQMSGADYRLEGKQ